MPIIDDILEAIQGGEVSEPFSAGDLARALRGKSWSSGSFAALLSKYAQAAETSLPLFVRVSRGRYRLAPTASLAQRKAHPPREAADNPRKLTN